jgi:hypothetical protein
MLDGAWLSRRRGDGLEILLASSARMIDRRQALLARVRLGDTYHTGQFLADAKEATSKLTFCRSRIPD